MNKKFICKICKKEMNMRCYGRHLRIKHNLSSEEYYLQYLNNEKGRCRYCNKHTKFKNITKGYNDFCNRSCVNKFPETIKKRIDTMKKNGTYEDLQKLGSTLSKKYGTWSKGLTKETDDRLKSVSKKISKRNKGKKRSKKTCENISTGLKKSEKSKIILDKIHKRQFGKTNTRFKRSEEDWAKSYLKQSKTMKEKIAKGDFTPCVTNSWANSRCKLSIEGFDKLYRSTWEAVFQILNPHCEYEKLRIPYEYVDNWHNYIVDFIDIDQKTVYEVKPNATKNNKRNIIKRKALIGWCDVYKYTYKEINDNWFMENASKIDYTKLDEKIYKGMKQFL